MTIANVTENAILELIYRATLWAGYAQNVTTTAQTQIQFSLHTADPTDTGTSTSSEVTYTGYGRVTVTRGAGFNAVVTDSGIATAAAVTFTAGTGGTGIVSFFATEAAGAGAQNILWSGAVSPVINSGNGVTPQLSPVNIQLD